MEHNGRYMRYASYDRLIRCSHVVVNQDCQAQLFLPACPQDLRAFTHLICAECQIYRLTS